jgi:hypothetical protein
MEAAIANKIPNDQGESQYKQEVIVTYRSVWISKEVITQSSPFMMALT